MSERDPINRMPSNPLRPHQPDSERHILVRIKDMQASPTVEQPRFAGHESEMSELSIERFVMRKKGAWYQVPKDLKNEDEQGS